MDLFFGILPDSWFAKLYVLVGAAYIKTWPKPDSKASGIDQLYEKKKRIKTKE